MYTTFSCLRPSADPTSTHACQSCRTRKVRCGRELPSCHVCITRGKGESCFYVARVNQRPACEPRRIAKRSCGRELPACKSCLRARAPNNCLYSTSRRSSQTSSSGQASSNRKGQAICKGLADIFDSLETRSARKPEPLMPMNEHQVDNVDGNTQSDERSPPPSPLATTPYSQLELSVSGPHAHASRQQWPSNAKGNQASLPPPLGRPLLGLVDACGESPPTFYQLLLVLNYIFISAMRPENDAAMWRIIYRHSADWEREFVLQYDEILSWLTSTRDALIEPCHLQTVSLGDLESQIRWILFLLGGQALSDSSFLQTCFQSDKCPYRPFGARASIALISLAFTGLQPEDIKNYNSGDIWPCGEQYYNLMASILGQSPVFEGGVGVAQLKAIMLRLHQAFQLEEERVAFTTPHEIYYDDDSSTYEYYRQAFLSLDPRLLPRICQLLCPTGLPVEESAHNLASICAKAFQATSSVNALEANSRIYQRLQIHRPIESWSLKCST